RGRAGPHCEGAQRRDDPRRAPADRPARCRRLEPARADHFGWQVRLSGTLRVFGGGRPDPDPRGAAPAGSRLSRKMNPVSCGAFLRNADHRMKKRYRIRQNEVTPYSPANHTGTKNFRLIGAETVGAKQLEVLIGEVEKGKGALPHAHPGIEQACYMLEGTAHVEVNGEAFEMKPGEACFFPADAPHLLQVTSESARIMVIYSPPYEENPARAVKHSHG